MKLLLIVPSWNYVHKSLRFISKKIAVSPPLGLMYVAGIGIASGWETRIIDCDAEGIDLDNLRGYIENFNPDVIGFSVTTPFYASVVHVAREIKKYSDAMILIGGPHPTAVGKDALLECFDFLMRGEAENGFALFLKEFETNRHYSSVPGLIFRDHAKVIANDFKVADFPLELLPVPARHLLKLNKYKTVLPNREEKIYTSVSTSRGCPYECVFCGANRTFGRSIRFRPVVSVVKEINECVCQYGIKHFHFIDDTLTVNRKYVFDLCRALKQEDLGITWEGWTRVDCIDEDLLTEMKNAGFLRISFGVETGNQEIMKNIKKGVTHVQISRSFELADKLGIESRCSAMIGHPGETKKTAWETINFIRGQKSILSSTLAIATPYPGTELMEMALKQVHGLRLLTMDTSRYFRYFSPVMEMNDLKSADLKMIQLAGLLWIHLTPRRIFYAFKRFGLKNICIASFLVFISLLRAIFLKIYKRLGLTKF